MEPKQKSASIFVSIVSYRDPECQHTIHDLFTKAKYPDRINVGVFWQCDAKEDTHCFAKPAPRPDQVRTEKIPYQEAKGACYARAQALKLWQNEEFILQIDSHMRFVESWDELLLNMHHDLEAQGHAKLVISTYAPDYDLENNFAKHISVITPIFKEGTYMFVPVLASVPQQQPILGACISGHFIFVRAKGFQEVPYDPNLFFMGEEINLSVRFWTRGYDIFHPHIQILYHLYNRQDAATSNRPLVFENKATEVLDILAKKRVNYLLGINQEKNFPYEDLDSYGLGSVRSLHEYELFLGLNLAKNTALTRCQKGIFFNFWDNLSAQHQNSEVFDQVFEKNLWGNKESVSGPGSTLANTENLRNSLTDLQQRLRVKSILDIPCGDLNYMASVNLEGIQYIGADCVATMIEQLRVRFRHHRNMSFLTLDAAREPLPKADLIICRDLVIHFPNTKIWQLLANIRASECKYMLMTHYLPEAFSHLQDHPQVNQEIQLGQYRPVNLTIAPFYLPAPLFVIKENEWGKTIGLWDLNTIELFLDPVPENLALLRLELAGVLQQLCTKLKNALIDNLSQAKRFFELLSSDDWQAFNALVDHDPFVSQKIKYYWIYRDKNIIFNLSFRADLATLQSVVPLLNEDNFDYAHAFSKDYIKKFYRENFTE